MRESKKQIKRQIILDICGIFTGISIIIFELYKVYIGEW